MGFVYSPLWKIIHQKPSVLCTPPFEKSLFLVDLFFRVGKYGNVISVYNERTIMCDWYVDFVFIHVYLWCTQCESLRRLEYFRWPLHGPADGPWLDRPVQVSGQSVLWDILRNTFRAFASDDLERKKNAKVKHSKLQRQWWLGEYLSRRKIKFFLSPLFGYRSYLIALWPSILTHIGGVIDQDDFLEQVRGRPVENAVHTPQQGTPGFIVEAHCKAMPILKTTEDTFSSRNHIILYYTSAKPAGASAIHQSINQSINQTEYLKSFNQPISQLIALIKQAINQSTYQSRHISTVHNQSINWLPFQNQFFSWMVKVSRFW